MCGIAGFVEIPIRHSLSDRDHGTVICSSRATYLVDRLRHRGPDDFGVFHDENGGATLVHARLAILDISSGGHQPMSTGDDQLVIVFNGEIFNFVELRNELVENGIEFTSGSDTEVLLQLYKRLGSSCLDRLQGMFAFAIWDRDERSLFLARDPLGIKPLYLCDSKGVFSFASEVRALMAMLVVPSPHQDAIAPYLMMGSVQEPDSIIDGITQLPAGHFLRWKDGRSELTRYWNVTYPADRLVEQSPSVSDKSNPVTQTVTPASTTRHALDDSIRRHFVSDVPVGIFLSGGIDSTVILALARVNGFDDLHTFCISFDESEFNEGDVAGRTADHFGTKHTDWRLTAREAKPLVEGYLHSVDSPSNDGFNTYCVSKLARDNGFKVVLSGLGGDELFGGYPSFHQIPRLLRTHRWLKILGSGLLNTLGKYSPARYSHKLRRMAMFASSGGSPLDAYWTMRAFFTPDEASQIVFDLTGSKPSVDPRHWLSQWDELDANDPNLVGYLETTRYMRNQLLRDSDVLSMAHGLELRVPFVDSRLYDVVNQIPAAIRYAPGKRLLLDAVPEIPDWVANQPKKGFRFPFETWMLEQFGEEYDSIQELTSVPLETWYRKWLVFSLVQFARRNGVQLRSLC